MPALLGAGDPPRRGQPDGRAIRISPLFTGSSPKNGSQVAVTGVLSGTELVAERVDILGRKRPRLWYHRGLLAAGELQPASIVLYHELRVWIRTTLASAPDLVDADLSPIVAAYPDQPALVAGTLGADGHVAEPHIYIRVGELYRCIYDPTMARITVSQTLTASPPGGLRLGRGGLQP